MRVCEVILCTVGVGAAQAEGTAMNDNTVCCQNRDQTEPAGETLDDPPQTQTNFYYTPMQPTSRHAKREPSRVPLIFIFIQFNYL
jgi:hypothetical protein